MQLVKNVFFKYFRDSWKYRYRAIVFKHFGIYIGRRVMVMEVQGEGRKEGLIFEKMVEPCEG